MPVVLRNSRDSHSKVTIESDRTSPMLDCLTLRKFDQVRASDRKVQIEYSPFQTKRVTLVPIKTVFEPISIKPEQTKSQRFFQVHLKEPTSNLLRKQSQLNSVLKFKQLLSDNQQSVPGRTRYKF